MALASIRVNQTVPYPIHDHKLLLFGLQMSISTRGHTVDKGVELYMQVIFIICSRVTIAQLKLAQETA